MRWGMEKYRKLLSDEPLPHIASFVFRHTFCTNTADFGMDAKRQQYFMGHPDVGVTMNACSHTGYGQAAGQMAKVIEFRKSRQFDTPEKKG